MSNSTSVSRTVSFCAFLRLFLLALPAEAADPEPPPVENYFAQACVVGDCRSGGLPAFDFDKQVFHQPWTDPNTNEPHTAEVQFQVRGLGSPYGPLAQAEGHFQVTGAANALPGSVGYSGSSSALVRWWARPKVTPLGLVLQVHTAPATVTFNLEVHATGPGTGLAQAVFLFPGSGTGYVARACTRNCVPQTPPTNSVSIDVEDGQDFQLEVNSSGEYQLTSEGVGTYLAAADPVVAISDELIPGTAFRYSDAFEIELSDGVVQTLTPFPDADGDAMPDEFDNCPSYASSDFTDADLDGRGNACECTDQNGDGRNSVSDLIAINQAIFDPARATALCDGNNDGLCNVNDIIAANLEIFSPGNTSICARQPVPGP
jgi:hypothetical protein